MLVAFHDDRQDACHLQENHERVLEEEEVARVIMFASGEYRVQANDKKRNVHEKGDEERIGEERMQFFELVVFHFGNVDDELQATERPD